MTGKKVVGIVGAGRIGNALARAARTGGHEVRVWDKDEKKLKKKRTLQETISGADVVFLCVPSGALRSVLKSLGGILDEKAVLVSLSKGIERRTLKIPAQILEEFSRGSGYAILGGPMLAEELNAGEGGIGVLGCKNRRIFSAVGDLLRDGGVKLIYARDPYSVSLAGVLKNIYSLPFGIAGALSWGGNRKGWMLVQSVKEMSEVARLLGGNANVVSGPAGLGDLSACILSSHSHNRRAGEQLVRRGRFPENAEGVVSAPSLFKVLEKDVEGLPVLSSLKKVFREKKRAREVFEELFENS